MERTSKRSKANEPTPTNSSSMSFSDVITQQTPDFIPFDENLLTHYRVLDTDAASRLVDLIRTIYAHGNQSIRDALANMTFCMYNQINQFQSMENQIAALFRENQHLKDVEQIQQESSQEHDHNKNFVIPALNVCFTFEFIMGFNS